MTTLPRTALPGRVLATLVASAALLVPAAGLAHATPPLDLGQEVTDEVGALDGRAAEVGSALEALADETPYQLFVVYVDTFDDLDPAEWADATAAASDLGRDDILLAVAVGSRRYQVSVDDAIDLTDDQLARVEQDRIEPALRDDDWAGAAVAAADGYRAEAAREGAGGRLLLGLLGGAAVVALAAWGVVVLRRRRAAARTLDELEDRAGQALVAADDAVQQSATELGFAEAQLGTDAVAPFVRALDEARTVLARAFEARRAADGTDDAGLRTGLTEVLALCDEVDAVLDAQTEELARVRDLHARAPQVLDDLAARADALDARAAAAAGGLRRLTTAYAAGVTSAVASHADDAAALVAGARGTVEQGRSLLEPDRAGAVGRAGEAEGTLARAASLLDAVDHLVADLAAAPDRIDTAVASISSDVTDAARLAPADPQVTAAVAEARAATAHARASRTAGDPLAALRRLAEAEARLDALLAPARAHEEALARAQQRLPVLLAQAGTTARSVADLLATDRGRVGPGPIGRNAEGRRLLADAQDLAASDPVAAVAAAEHALACLSDAYRGARADVDAARQAAQGRSTWTAGTGWGGSGGGWSSGASGRRTSSSHRSSSSRRTSSSSSRRSSSGRSSGRRGGGGRF